MEFSGIGGVSGAIQKARGAQSELATVSRIRQPLAPRWCSLLRAASVSIAALAASVTFAATTTVSTLIDADNNAASGCSISTANGAFAGVDKVLNTIVVADATGYRISSITQQACSGGTLGPATLVDASSTPLARGNGSSGTTAVETYLPNAFLPANGQKMRIGITTLGSDGLTGADALTLSGAGPILVDGPPLMVVPTLAKLSLALTALLLALSVWFARRRGWHGMQLVIVAAFAISMSGQLIAAIVRDGFVGDWTGIAPVATDPTGDAPAGTDITTLFSTVDRDNVYFRIDMVLNAPPVANAQSVVAVANVALPITLTGSDYEASPLTFTVVAPPAHGALTGTAPNLTYTANSTYGGPDSFTFRTNDGVLNSADATVTIDVKLPPTITSVNNATFIPGQANSFNFTATGVPSATFALSACNVALPPSVAVTNNGNNTATLAGNPTVAQGGTYSCTLTASNGFGSNATQAFTLNLGLPPTFTSANATTFIAGTAGSFTVTTTATPATTGITQTGTLPTGVTFTYNGPGTPLNGTFAGTPAAGTGGVYPITLTAANGIPPNTVQNFTLTVNQTPAITSANSTTCVVGAACSFTVTASGFPVPAIARGGVALPTGMTYVDNGNGTGTLSGTPALGTVNPYALTFTPGNGVGAPAAQPFTLTISKASQTISYSSAAPAGASVGGATYAVAATATSTLAPAFSIDASAATVCSISGATVSFIGVGTCVINANQAGNADYNAAPQVQQSFAVVKGNQTINFTSTVPATAKVAGPTYTVTATATSGLTPAFTVDASASAVCSISGATVSLLTVGTCVINANQAGNTNYNAAPQLQQSFAVAKGDQTIVFTSTAPATAKVGGPTYTVAATASPSALPVTFTIDVSAAAVCSISGVTVSFLTAGTCVVNANQAGGVNYNAAPQVQQSFVVAKGDQTINFTSTAPTAAKVAGATYTVTATATSGLAPAFTIDATATAVCSISGSTVSFTTVGTCVINANQAGNVNYNAAPQVQQSFAVAKGDQTIAFTSTAPAAAKVAGATYTVTATATSGLAVGFTIDATASAVCSISGATVTFIGAGTCVIDANQAGNATYSAATQVQQLFAVAKGDQTTGFTSSAPTTAAVGGPAYTVTASVTSGLAPTFSIDPSATAVCSISGATVSFLSVGTCVINANQAGNANYNAAPQVQQTFAVAKGSQTVSFTSAAPAPAAVGGATYSVTATATSGLTPTFTIDASATAVCSISGSTVSFTSAGTCVINANQAGNANYNAAPQAQQSFAVGKGSQTISFTSTVPATATVGGATYTVTATASSALAVTFTIDASAAAVCSISGAAVSFIGNGTCVINANQAGNANYNAATQAQQSFAVNKGGQTINFTSPAPTTASFNGATYTVTAIASSGLAVSFAIDATATSVCSIAGATVSFIGAGTCVINANQAGNASFNAAPQAQQSFAVAKGDQTITFTSTNSVGTVGGATYTVAATASSGLAVSFTIAPPAASVCSISGTTVSFIGVGTCVIFANQAGNANYNAAPQQILSLAVSKGSQTISFTSTAPTTATVGGPDYTVSATATSALVVAFTSGSPAVCSVSGTTVTYISAGTCTINANQAGDANYNAAPQVQQSFAVKSNQTISFTSSAPTTAAVGGAAYTVTATASSGLAVSFTIDPSASSVCSIVGSTVSFGPNAGTCVINANQAGNASYFAAPQVQQSFAVRKTQTVVFTSIAPTVAVYNGSYTVTATASSGLVVSLTVDASATGVCSIAGALVSFIGTGTCVIDANQAGDATWYPALQVQQTFTVGPNLQNDSYNVVGNTQFVVAGHSAPVTPFTANATTILSNDTSNVAITLTTVSGVATTGGGLITIDSAGAFTYTPPAGQSSGTDTYVYTGTSNGVSRTATITFNIPNIVWYVDNASAATTHDGRSNTPFLNMGAGANGLGTALSGAGPAANANIYVYKGTASTIGAYTFKGGQTLTGAASTLTVGALSMPGSLANRPTLAGTLSAVSAATGITVTGISMSTGASDAVNFINASADFIGGGLTIATTSGLGFKASGGGTVTVQGAGNTIATTTGTALTVSGTTIGASGLNYQSISAGTAGSGPANGIVLTNTGGGTLSISGDGTTNTCKTGTTTCSGGTIQKATADGIALTNARADLKLMWIKNNANSGIKGTTVNRLAMADLLIQNNTNNTGEQAGILINDLADSAATATRIEVSGSTEDNVRIHNSATTGTIVFDAATIKDNSSASGNNGIFFQSSLSGNLTGTVQNSTLTGNAAVALSADSGDSSTLNATFKGNTVTAGAPNQGNQGIQVSRAVTSTLTFNVDSNTVSGMISTLINVFSGSGPGTATGAVKNNVITGTGVGGNQFGIRAFNSGSSVVGFGTMNVNVANNTISAIDNAYPILGESSGSTGAGGQLKIAVTGNTANVVSGGTALDAIRVQARNNSTVCAKVSGNVSSGGGPGFFGLQLRRANPTSAFNLEGLTAGVQSDPTVQAFVNGQNPSVSGGSGPLAAVGQASVTGVGAGSCGITP